MALIFAVFIGFSFPCLSEATDFSDPGDAMLYLHKQRSGHSSFPELDGTIESASSAKPGWYRIALKREGEKTIFVFAVPATKFFKDYMPLASRDAYPLLVQGCKLRALHDPDQDQLLRNTIITDLMFESAPVELAGTIKNSTSAGPGVYDLTVNLKDGGEHHLNLDLKTKFWKNNKPLDAAAAYPQLMRGQTIRTLEKPAPGGRHWTSDLMFVDR